MVAPAFLDDLLALQVPKIIVIRDWRLGVVRWIVVIAVLAYFIALPVWIEHCYLDLREVAGSSSLHVLGLPDHLRTNFADLPYCEYYAGTSDLYEGAQYPCQAMPYEWINTGSSTDFQFLPTMVRYRSYNMTCVQALDSWNMAGCHEITDYRYIPQIELVPIGILHNAVDVGGRIPAFDMNDYIGKLVFSDGSEITVERGQTSSLMKYVVDSLTVDQLLRAAGLEMNKHLRQHGITLMLTIEYKHDRWGRFSGYTYKVRQAGHSSPHYTFSTDSDANGSSITEAVSKHRNGIEIHVVRSGQVGVVSIQALLIGAVAASALLHIGAFFLNFLMKVIPEKTHYKMLQEDRSARFTGIRSAAVTVEEHRHAHIVHDSDNSQRMYELERQVEKLVLEIGKLAHIHPGQREWVEKGLSCV